MAVGRYQHTATLLSNGDVLIAGGSSSFGTDNNNAEIYHAADGTFSSLITMTTHILAAPRRYCLMARCLSPVDSRWCPVDQDSSRPPSPR